MKLYLMQHGEAMWEEHDPARPLTEKGRAATNRVVQYAVERAGVRVARIVHSGKLRARQTAKIWREHLPAATITEEEELGPQASPEIWRERLIQMTDDLLIVGHLPHLARLAALLLCGHEGTDPIMVQNAGLICLERRDHDGWSVRWALTPEIV
jgi:phosphohistidine phosphatase